MDQTPQAPPARPNLANPDIFEAVPNVHAREAFRKESYFSGIAVGVISGLGAKGYELALEFALQHNLK